MVTSRSGHVVNPRVPAGEKKRLQAEHRRGLEVLKAIDDADTAAPR
jgi:hypothetical protein